jgi:hypothetical protein
MTTNDLNQLSPPSRKNLHSATWTTTAIERLGILRLIVSDGPHDVRRVSATPSAGTILNTFLKTPISRVNELSAPSKTPTYLS